MLPNWPAEGAVLSGIENLPPHCLMLGQGHLEEVRHPVSKVQALGAALSSAEPSPES